MQRLYTQRCNFVFNLCEVMSSTTLFKYHVRLLDLENDAKTRNFCAFTDSYTSVTLKSEKVTTQHLLLT